MTKNKGVSVRQRRVSGELRRLRLLRKMTCKQVAEGVDFSESKISRMETGDRGLYPDDVAAILGFLQAPSDLRQELMALVRGGEERNWHEVNGKLPPTWKDLIRFEEQASVIKNYETLLIPGIAQIPEYSRELIRGNDTLLTETEVESLVAARATRQLILSRRDAPSVHLIIDEMALHRQIGDSATMHNQLRHLLQLSRRSNVTVEIAPFAAGAHPGLRGPFVLLEFHSEPTLAHVESRGTSSFLEEDDYIDSVKTAWRSIRSIALSSDASARMIADMIGESTQAEEYEP
ncbi:helix-turn-helix transcriptional regulator [Amycolatopsis sp. DSM 110486]|uniref:helix-turn-helix domain-containing protein n=1 Tax=Amycolatopsis sp. DSM 110486 TaxID=2865832 RepID=UPI001C695615|nr:helix-turn-helix transcriptional regulator [Amycolatopsis sp. DSM 110486]QYN25039.1 helix-turn-helix domain-containing protein [Amycolatopsis sp. DSM 110486]